MRSIRRLLLAATILALIGGLALLDRDPGASPSEGRAPPSSTAAVASARVPRRARVDDSVLTAKDLGGTASTPVLLPEQASEMDGGIIGLVQAWAADELLVQEAVRRGLHRSDPVVRQRLATLIYESDVLGPEGPPRPSETELRRFHLENRDTFVHPAEVRCIVLVLEGRPRDDSSDLLEAVRGLESASSSEGALAARGLSARVGTTEGRASTWRELQREFGPRVANAAFSIEASRDWTCLTEARQLALIRTLSKRESERLPFSACRAAVEDEYRRRVCARRYQRLILDLARRHETELPAGLWDTWETAD